MRMTFDELFKPSTNGRISPRVRVRIGGVTMGPGAGFGGGVAIGGLNLIDLVGRDFDVEVQGGVHVIKGVYN